MHFKLIVATDSENGIGKQNALPWKCKEDMRNFSKKTKKNNNNAIIMGRNTWDSLNRKPLKDRDNYILSRSSLIIPNEFQKNTFGFTDVNAIVETCKNKTYDEVWVIGGEQIYNLFLNKNLISEIYVTRISGTYQCDTFFSFNKQYFILKEKSVLTSEKSNCQAVLEIYVNCNKDYQ